MIAQQGFQFEGNAILQVRQIFADLISFESLILVWLVLITLIMVDNIEDWFCCAPSFESTRHGIPIRLDKIVVQRMRDCECVRKVRLVWQYTNGTGRLPRFKYQPVGGVIYARGVCSRVRVSKT